MMPTATVASNAFLTSGHANLDFGLKLNSYDQSGFTWTANTFGGSYCVEIGNDGHPIFIRRVRSRGLAS